MHINEAINTRNIQMFRVFGTRKPNQLRHQCVLCENRVDINGSYSTAGGNLICRTCYRERFESAKAANDFVYGSFSADGFGTEAEE